MKKLLFLFLFIPLLAFTQVPQGVGYQGVATDANGIELVNQSISIRASIISASPTGTIEWQETHTTSTDTFGLFTLTIGQGTSNGNGAQTSFADITWGANTHFLKIEMDVNGGTNYSHMGTNQMMSVPYALYAENANINYDSIATILSNDSSFVTTVSGGIGVGSDFRFPDGLDGDFIAIDILQGDYTVPAGKNLYILNALTDAGNQIINLDGKHFIKYDNGYWQYNTEIAMAGSGSVLSNQYQSSTPNSSTMFGFLIDKKVDFIAIDILQGDYTVPAGKNLYILNALTDAGNQIINLDGKHFIKYDNGYWQYNTEIAMASSGSVLSNQYQSSIPNSSTMFGYLVDENYFASSGGGSSSSTVDSSYIDSLVQFYSNGNGVGCDYKFPEGLEGTLVTHDFNNGQYTVPSGKNLYITYLYRSGNGAVQINSVDVLHLSNNGNSPFGAVNDINLYLSENDIIDVNGASGSAFHGVLTDNNNVLPICQDLNGSSYTVPIGKKLIIKLLYNRSISNDLFLNGIEIGQGEINHNGNVLEDVISNTTLILESGDLIEGVGGYNCSFNGYLVDENYFADCGGGSSSSTVDSSYIDSLVQYYVSNNTIGGCNIDPFFPDGMEGVEYKSIYITNSTPYTVPANKTFYLFSRQTNLYLNGNGRVIEYDHFFPIPIAEGNVLSLNSGSINGYLIDKGFEVKNYLGGDSIYIVPNDMYFYVLHNDSYINVDGITSVGGSTNYPSGTSSARTPLVFQPGSSITSPYGISGLLIPTDYCNQGGSSSSGGGNNSGGGGCDYMYPDGLNGDIISRPLDNVTSYTVPTGKRFYILSYPTTLYVDGFQVVGLGNGTPYVANEGQVISSNSSSFYMLNGYLVDLTPLEVISRPLDNVTPYTVPTGKRFYILSYPTTLYVDGFQVIGLGNGTPFVANEGQVVSSNTSSFYMLNGYLADENYFADCGGGGNSSGGGSFSSSNVSISTFGDTLYINGQTIMLNGISNQNMTPNFSSVTDIDGNTYQTVYILGREWMTEDLRVTKFNNGDPIYHMTSSSSWTSSQCTSPGYINHNGVILYNGFVIADSRNVCPAGWSIPTTSEYEEILDMFNDGEWPEVTSNAYAKTWEHAGIKLKSEDLSLNGHIWTNANNHSFLNFMPQVSSNCTNVNSYGWGNQTYYWTSTPAGYNPPDNWALDIENNSSNVTFMDMSHGGNSSFTTRCIKD